MESCNLTALHFAAERENAALVQKFLELGLTGEITKEGKGERREGEEENKLTVLDMARKSGHAETIALLEKWKIK